jgi:Rieske Fe-S protein
MSRVFEDLSRRGLLKGFLALPLVKFFESLILRQNGTGVHAAVPPPNLKVAKVSQLERPWSTVSFEYFIKVQGKDIKGDTIREEYLPGIVVRLPDDVAQQRGGGVKSRFEVVNLYCTHQRCKTAFIRDPNEIQSMIGQKVAHPVFYCPCHRSLFDPTKSAEPIKGSEAKEALWKFNFEVKGDDIVVTGVDPKTSSWPAGNPGGLVSEYPVRPGEPGL